MSTKSTPKKKAAKKPLKQQNPFADAHRIVMQALESQAEFLIDWRKRMEDRLTAIESKLPAPTKGVEGVESSEEWAPMVGDWVMPSDKYIALCPSAKETYSKPMQVLSSNGEHFKTDNTDGLGWHISNIRPATDAEVAIYNKEKQAEADKLSRLKFGTLVSTQFGKGVYVMMSNYGPHYVIYPNTDLKQHSLSDITLIEP